MTNRDKLKEPMGVSQWKKYGVKFGYWDYFVSRQKLELIKEIEGMKKDKRFPYQALEFGDCPYCGCEINREWINDKLKEVRDEFLSDVLERLK